MKKKTHADSKKEDIIAAALKLFAKNGFEGTTVKEIGDEAGVTDAAIYKHFSSKTEIASALLAKYSKEIVAMVDHIAGQPVPFSEKFCTLIEQVLCLCDEERFGVLFLCNRPEFFQQQNEEQRLPWHAFYDFIDTAVKKGDLPEQNVSITTAILVGALTRLPVISECEKIPSQLKPSLEPIQKTLLRLVGG